MVGARSVIGLVFGSLVALASACGSSETDGGASSGCGNDNDCKGDRICVKGDCVDPGAPSCLEDCVSRTGDEDSCRAACGGGSGGAGGGSGGAGGGSGGAGGGSGGAGGGSGGAGGGSTGGAGGGAGTGTGGAGGMPGPTAVCPYGQATARGTLQEGPGDATFDAVFSASGALVSVNGMPCAIDMARPGMATGPICNEYYLCGACDIEVQRGEAGDFYVSASGCSVDGFYGLCTPDCTGKECGSDGCGSDCGQCSPPNSCSGGQCRDICGDCLSNCSGLPGVTNCCMCSGCICESECFDRCP